MIGNFKDVTETLRNRFAESPLGKQLEGMELSNIDNNDDSSLDAYVSDVSDEVCDHIDKAQEDVFIDILDEFPEKFISEGLLDEEKEKIKAETGWADEIINSIKNMEQYEIYKSADLHEEEINGRKCLLKDIDLDYVDLDTGLTNRELMEKGRSPIDSKSGEKIELHHMGQEFDSPFAELSENSEHGDGNHKILHEKLEDSWRNNQEFKNQYQVEKRNHWKTRVQEV